MKKGLFYISICLLILACQAKFDTPNTIALDENWQFKDIKDTLWNPASVPGNVHSDLLQNELIKHPFIKDNELQLQWISETNWEYKTKFYVNTNTLNKKHIELNFEGLDTYASVYLNDSLILKSNNAFRRFQVDVKSILKTKNELRIVFEKTSISEDKEKGKLNYTLPEGNRIFTRKAQFQYGWDWGPKLNTFGIWKSIYLRSWNDLKIRDVYINQLELNDSLANLVAEFKIDSNLTEELTGEIFVNDSLVKTFIIDLKKSLTEVPFQIQNPKKWWPHNLGEPNLYEISIVVKMGRTKLDYFGLLKGLRTIELVTDKDSIGESFYFIVNGVPVYAKGANYIPQNSMQNQVTEEQYERLLDDVVDANMNMLRVWGGGIYENDIFYNLCDKKGILVWQDFMFACAMYLGDDAFLDNVQQEAIDNVKRLRHHASIALWCGNNENSEGWHRWGWQDGRSEEEKEEIWTNYLKVFDSILPETVKELTDTDYWESSPKYGRGNPKYKVEGDAHDWWIWHDAYPFEHLENNVPRFMSEFGFQSFPSYEVIKYINQSDSLDITSEEFKTHQKHTRGFQLIRDYMERDFPVPDKAEDYVYVSQLLQAYGITKGIEAHRRARPKNMGTLFWQLNDCWPAVSWSSIDFFGNWKALHYKAKGAFKNVLISSLVENDILKTYIVNDKLNVQHGTLSIKILDFKGNIIWESSNEIETKSNASILVHELELKSFEFNKNRVIIVTRFNNHRSNFYLVRPKELQLHEQNIQQKITKTKHGFNIELQSNTLQKDVFLFCNETGHFTDNYFDLLPNEVKNVEFETTASSIKNLNIKTLNSI